MFGGLFCVLYKFGFNGILVRENFKIKGIVNDEIIKILILRFE